MSKIAVMEKHPWGGTAKAREYYRSDYVAVQLLKMRVILLLHI